MNLYLLTQDENCGYDTFDSCVVAAKSEEDARQISPRPGRAWDDPWSSWASKPESVKVVLIGTAIEGTDRGLILASFNAG